MHDCTSETYSPMWHDIYIIHIVGWWTSVHLPCTTVYQGRIQILFKAWPFSACKHISNIMNDQNIIESYYRCYISPNTYYRYIYLLLGGIWTRLKRPNSFKNIQNFLLTYYNLKILILATDMVVFKLVFLFQNWL